MEEVKNQLNNPRNKKYLIGLLLAVLVITAFFFVGGFNKAQAPEGSIETANVSESEEAQGFFSDTLDKVVGAVKKVFNFGNSFLNRLEVEEEFIENPLSGGDSDIELIPSKSDVELSYAGPNSDIIRYGLIGVSSANRPLISRIYINPLDTWIGEEQSIVVHIRNENPVDSASVEVITDNEENTYVLEVVEQSGKDSYWKGSWVVSDTHGSQYDFIFRATSGEDDSELELHF